ncbi:hypothetical protein QBC39DRAFT_420639 [Podospora conica]|nr:hypothetical protein QBC39DRAFT_420639 [Schizothecium conicum]
MRPASKSGTSIFGTSSSRHVRRRLYRFQRVFHAPRASRWLRRIPFALSALATAPAIRSDDDVPSAFKHLQQGHSFATLVARSEGSKTMVQTRSFHSLPSALAIHSSRRLLRRSAHERSGALNDDVLDQRSQIHTHKQEVLMAQTALFALPSLRRPVAPSLRHDIAVLSLALCMARKTFSVDGPSRAFRPPPFASTTVDNVPRHAPGSEICPPCRYQLALPFWNYSFHQGFRTFDPRCRPPISPSSLLYSVLAPMLSPSNIDGGDGALPDGDDGGGPGTTAKQGAKRPAVGSASSPPRPTKRSNLTKAERDQQAKMARQLPEAG